MRQGKHDAASLKICTLAAGFALTEEVTMTVLTIVIVIALLATVVTLLWGIASLRHEGEFDQYLSHQLMFARASGCKTSPYFRTCARLLVRDAGS